MRYCISCIAACENPQLAIPPIFNARHMSDCSSCTQPPCLAILADMLKSYKKLVAASNNEIWQLYAPYSLLRHPLWWFMTFSSTPRDVYQNIPTHKPQRYWHDHVRIYSLSGQIFWKTMRVSCYGQKSNNNGDLFIYPPYIIWLVDRHFHCYEYTPLQLHATSDSCCFQFYRQFLNVCPGSYLWWPHWQRCGGLTGVCVLSVCRRVTYWV
jgi:hypothetical protein